jgi:predicted Zn finger-like uncharacterized protein
MPHVIDCPSCDRKLRVPDELRGQAVQCPTCGTTFTAPRDLSEAALLPSRFSPQEIPPLDQYDEDYEPPRSSARPPPPPAHGHHDEDSPRWSRHGREYVPHRGALILIVGIFSIVMPCPLTGVILGPIAWIMGNTDIQEIRTGQMDPDGEGLVNAGRICGMIGTILHAIALIPCCVVSGLFFHMVGTLIGP